MVNQLLNLSFLKQVFITFQQEIIITFQMLRIFEFIHFFKFRIRNQFFLLKRRIRLIFLNLFFFNRLVVDFLIIHNFWWCQPFRNATMWIFRFSVSLFKFVFIFDLVFFLSLLIWHSSWILVDRCWYGNALVWWWLLNDELAIIIVVAVTTGHDIFGWSFGLRFLLLLIYGFCLSILAFKLVKQILHRKNSWIIPWFWIYVL